MDKKNIREHVQNAQNVAKRADEVERWGENIDFATASKAFNVNLLIFSDNFVLVYAPDLENSVFYQTKVIEI